MKGPYNKLIALGALVGLIGYVMSGPVAFFLVRWIQPQPVWVSPAEFVAHYSPIQDVPFYFGNDKFCKKLIVNFL